MIKSNDVKTITAMAICMFLAILDIHLLSSSLPTLSVELGYSLEETTQVQTSYLVAEIISIVLAGILTTKFGIYKVYILSIILFAIASFMCLASLNLEMLIFSRAIQGLAGGALISLCMASTYLIFTENGQQLSVSASISSLTTIAPILGPVVGGVISEFISWRILFLINIPFCVVALILMKSKLDSISVRDSKFNIPIKLTLLIAACFSMVFFVLEEGVKYFWSKEAMIILIGSLWLTVLSIKMESNSKVKVVKFELLKNTKLTSLMLMLMIFSMTHFMYLYMLILLGNDLFDMGPKDISHLLIITGLAQIISSFFVPSCCRKLGMFTTTAIGIGLLILSVLLIDIDMNTQTHDLFIPQILRGTSFMFMVIPMQNMIMQIPSAENKVFVSSIFNIFKNLGGAIAIAFINTLIIFATLTYQKASEQTVSNENIYRNSQFINSSLIEANFRVEQLSSITIINQAILFLSLILFSMLYLTQWSKK